MRAASRRAIDDLLDRVTGGTEIDLVSEVSDSFTMIVLSELLQVPDEVRVQVQERTATLALGFGVHAGEHLAAVDDAILSLFDIIDDLIAYRRAHPADGLLNDLISARDEGDRLSDEELRSMVVGVLFAGHDTPAATSWPARRSCSRGTPTSGSCSANGPSWRPAPSRRPCA